MTTAQTYIKYEMRTRVINVPIIKYCEKKKLHRQRIKEKQLTVNEIETIVRFFFRSGTYYNIITYIILFVDIIFGHLNENCEVQSRVQTNIYR